MTTYYRCKSCGTILTKQTDHVTSILNRKCENPIYELVKNSEKYLWKLTTRYNSILPLEKCTKREYNHYLKLRFKEETNSSFDSKLTEQKQ
jgi:hypothetical protein